MTDQYFPLLSIRTACNACEWSGLAASAVIVRPGVVRCPCCGVELTRGLDRWKRDAVDDGEEIVTFTVRKRRR